MSFFIEGGREKQALATSSLPCVVSHWSKSTTFQIPYISGLCHTSPWTESLPVRSDQVLKLLGHLSMKEILTPKSHPQGSLRQPEMKEWPWHPMFNTLEMTSCHCFLARKQNIQPRPSSHAELRTEGEAPKSRSLYWGKHRS